MNTPKSNFSTRQDHCQPPDNGLGYQVRDEAPVGHFTMIPHLVDDSDLSAAAIRLYLHLKRVSGEQGACWQSQDTLARHCRIYRQGIIKTKQELETAGLIRIETGIASGHPTHFITIVDIWKQNQQTYGKDVNRYEKRTDIGPKNVPISVRNPDTKKNPKEKPLRITKSSSSDLINFLLEQGFNSDLVEMAVQKGFMPGVKNPQNFALKICQEETEKQAAIPKQPSGKITTDPEDFISPLLDDDARKAKQELARRVREILQG